VALFRARSERDTGPPRPVPRDVESLEELIRALNTAEDEAATWVVGRVFGLVRSSRAISFMVLF